MISYSGTPRVFTPQRASRVTLDLSTGAEASEELIGSIGYNPFIGVANNAMVSADGVVSSAALRHNDDWADAALHNGMRQEYYLSLQGGNAKTTHFFPLLRKPNYH